MKKTSLALVFLSFLFSAVAYAALVHTTEVLVLASAPTALPQLTLRKAVEIQNLGPNAIYCAVAESAKAVVLKSRRIDANGGTWALSAPHTLPIYCIAATADQVTGAATIVTELR